MQTENDFTSRANWSSWAGFLRRYGLENITAWFLEAAGPMILMGSQVLSFGAPLMRPWLDENKEKALSALLEDREEASAFATFLRQDVGR
jgi:hypothetical protein